VVHNVSIQLIADSELHMAYAIHIAELERASVTLGPLHPGIADRWAFGASMALQVTP